MRSFFASCMIARAKSRACRELTTGTAPPAACNTAAAAVSSPPVASSQPADLNRLTLQCAASFSHRRWRLSVTVESTVVPDNRIAHFFQG